MRSDFSLNSTTVSSEVLASTNNLFLQVLTTYYVSMVVDVFLQVLTTYCMASLPCTTCNPPRALSLRNLVSGYECWRVFPAGVGPDSPSRDAANWLPSQFILSVEMRRRYGWLRVVLPGARLFRAPIWCPSGGVAARERQGTPWRRAW